MTKRVLHVVWSLNVGGAERSLYQLVTAQRSGGIGEALEADVLLGSSGGFYVNLMREAGAHVHELGQRRALDPRGVQRIRAVLKNYDIVHFHAREPLLIAAAAREPNIGLYYTHRGGNRNYPIRKRIRHRIIGHHLRRRFDGIAANTMQAAHAAAHIYGLPFDSIQVIYNGLDFSLMTPRRPRSEILAELGDPGEFVVRIGTTAILRPLKRIERLLSAVSALRTEHIHCYVFGDGPARKDLERLADQLGIRDRVTFVGHKPLIGDYLQVLDVFTLPSGPEESFGNAVVEAMGVGIPCVVFADGGGLTEHVDDGVTGFVVDGQNEFIECLSRLVRDEDLRRQIGDAAKTAVRERYTLGAMVARHSSLYGVTQEDSGAGGP